MINQELNINPNIIYAENILSKKDSKVIGHIHLMLYDNNPKSIPHLEYEIKEIEYHNKKIIAIQSQINSWHNCVSYNKRRRRSKDRWRST